MPTSSAQWSAPSIHEGFAAKTPSGNVATSFSATFGHRCDPTEGLRFTEFESPFFRGLCQFPRVLIHLFLLDIAADLPTGNPLMAFVRAESCFSLEGPKFASEEWPKARRHS
jgi:hypothetical protein